MLTKCRVFFLSILFSLISITVLANENLGNMPVSDSITSQHPQSSIQLVSWNIQHLGRSKSDEEIWQMAQILRHYDIIAIQEVVAKDPAGAQAVARLADELNRMGAKWDYQVSEPTKSPSSYISERYAFIWKTSKVKMRGRAYLDEFVEDIFYREPFIGHFRSKKSKQDFIIANYHSRKHYDEPAYEIVHFIDYQKRFKTDRVIIAGDFNLTADHQVWKPLYHKGFSNAMYEKPTTLKRKCDKGNYLNHAIDNFYYLGGIQRISAAPIDFVGACENLISVRKLSDHLPILLEFRIKE